MFYKMNIGDGIMRCY